MALAIFTASTHKISGEKMSDLTARPYRQGKESVKQYYVTVKQFVDIQTARLHTVTEQQCKQLGWYTAVIKQLGCRWYLTVQTAWLAH